MDELSIWEKINACKTVDELKQTIVDIWSPSGTIIGRQEPFSVSEMLVYIDWFTEDWNACNKNYRALPTRKYGIRQQLLFILERPARHI